MHSSSGKTVSVADAADMYPRALLWWMVARKQPHDTIRFDPVESQLEEARLLRNAHQDEALGVVEQAVGVAAHLSEYPRGHLIIAAQLGGFNPQQTLAILQRSAKYAASTIPPTQDDLDALHVWLNQVATQYRIDGIRSTDSRPTIAEQFVGPIQALLRKFESIEWSGEAINNAIHEVSRESEQTPKALFAELYRLILGPSYGPKIGWLFESIGKNRVMELLR